MAHGGTRKTGRKESIADLVDDLKLLRVSARDYTETRSSMEKARQQKIEKLRKANGTLDEGYKTILVDLEQTCDRWHILKKFCERIYNVLQETQAMCPDENDSFMTGAKEYIKDLEKKRYPVLIAGETSAGKSSLINLLLDDQVMPTCIMQSTLTICEISYGRKKQAVIHFAKQGKPSLKLEGKEFDKIQEYVEKPIDDDNWCEKIEIKIPHPLLKGGVVIVDSPGIGDSEHVSKIVLEYMSQAFAFIYVINSPNAGGLQEDRLLRIVRKWKTIYQREKRGGITAESALFVCNKWDDVERQTIASQPERENLYKNTVTKLKEKIPDLDEKAQVITMSVFNAAQVHKKFDVLNDDLYRLVNGIQRLLPLCVERKTEFFYNWISGHLTKFSDQVKAEMKNAQRNKEERHKAREEIQLKLQKLRQGITIREIEEAFSDHVNRISERVKSYFQSDDVRSAFCTWAEKDLPQIEEGHKGNLGKLKETYNACIEQRFQSFLQKFENKEKLFSTAHTDLEACFHRGFFDFEKDIREIDRVLVGESMDEIILLDVHPGKLRPPLDPRLKKFLVVSLVAFMPVLFPIGFAAGVLSAPVFGYFAVGKHLKEKNLKENPCQALKELSGEFLQEFIEHEVVNHVWQEFTEEKNRIDSIKRCHEELIAKYEQRCKHLTKSEDEESEKAIMESHDPLFKKLEEIHKQLMFDAIQHGIQVMYPSCQINKERLCEEKDPIGDGSFGIVFKGKYRPPGHGGKKVAVKRLKNPPEPSNVASFLGEAAMFMQLKHKYIVAFYGVVMEVHKHSLSSLGLVFKLCSDSLKNYIFKNEKRIPWKTKKAAALTFQWSKQILDALEFIHSKEIVHRDLKLDNVLVSKNEHVKVADLGLAKLKSRITGTMCGTLLYMAPEVRQGKAYDSKADMYSFGLMMWEMWFGERVPGILSSLSPDRVSRRIEDKGNGYAPPENWINLMASSWDSDPSLRRTAEESGNVIKEIMANYAK